ncbi:hypothetical protein JD844_027663 [Phrynosoma platyrhinos]|uniref:non-specific serine/threonine protein kinase n=1 Tax=Phrynosoma platyrhinos TaxID=52577 RepID=A0ABQ7SGS5_PHRPL|nr:hypothetical protein JD844_027663 [Phrynosoma platyrhinos]
MDQCKKNSGKKIVFSKQIICKCSLLFVDEITLLLLEEGTDVFLLVFDAMDTFSDNEEIQKYGCKALHMLLEKASNVEVLMSGNVRCYNIIVEMMKTFPKSEPIQEVSCCLLHKLTLVCAPFPACSRLPVHREMMLAMLMHSSSKEVFQAAANALATLLEQNGALKNAQNRSLGDADLALTLKVIKNQCLLEGTHSLVLDALNTFIGNPGIQKCGFQILSSVVECSGALEILTQQGMADTVLHTLQMYPDDQDIQCLGLSLLRSLITRKTLCIATIHVLAIVLVSTLRRFKDVVEIQVQFQSLCCKCFAKIADNDDLKNLMLEKACAEYNSIMAECLLLLGADVNKKTKANSLIYQVCEKGSNPKLVELLLNSGAREQDVRSALTVSIKKGDSQIISLLLKKLSLDTANSSICLGGFCMGRIEPSWLSPLFPDKRASFRKPTNAGSALARMVLSYQRTSSYEDQSRSSSDVNTCEDTMEKCEDWAFLPDPLVDSVFRLSDDIDSEGSESSYLVKRKSNSVATADLHKDIALQKYSPALPRHCNSVGAGSHYEPLRSQRRKMMSSEESHSMSKFQPNLKHSDSFSSSVSEKEYIKSLDLSSNELENIDGISQSSCLTIHLEHLEKLELHLNALSGIPEQLCETLKCLSYLDLHSNRFTIFPPYLLKMPCIAHLDVSRNDIGPSLTLDSKIICATLKLLNLSYNQLSCIPEFLADVAKKLEHLVLEGNKLSEVCSPIRLKELKVLNISKNTISFLVENFLKECLKLETLNAGMNLLDAISDLPSNITTLKLSQNKFSNIPEAILLLPQFLQQRLKKAVPYNRMKLMIVGNTGSGKTTLLQQLMKCKHPDLGVQTATVGIDVNDWKVTVKGKVKKDLVLNVWDFAGQEEFYSAHPHFMTQRALYLAVYDLSKGEAEVDAMKPWLFNIKARASSSPVILIGTHLDISNEKHRKACVSKITKELMNQRGFPTIQDYHFVNATEESDAMTKLRKTIIKESLNFKIRDQPVVGQLIPDSYLELEKRILEERTNVPVEFPVIDQKRLFELVQENKLQLDENELPHAVHFLNESDPALQLRDLYFVDPKWLCKIMAQILTVKVEGFPKYPKGIIKRSDVEKFLLKKNKFPKIYMSQYFKLLEKFQIALPLGEDQLLVPSSLSDHRPVIELPHCENSEIIIRLYEMPYFPMGFWSRLINRLLEVSPYMLSGRERILRPNRMYWRQGIYLNWSPEAYCLVESAVFENNSNSFLKITVPSCRKDVDVCGEGETLLKKWALYSFEDGEEHQKILLDDLLKKAEEAQIAPDLILADLPRNIMLNNDELEFDQTPEFLLAVRPRMLVMELAPKGSLDRLLQQDYASLTRTLQHRIALHVADGLRYLHSAMIIYRDLKPHNVLLFTLYPNSAVIAKIADYGIAQYCCRMGIKTSEGTPGMKVFIIYIHMRIPWESLWYQGYMDEVYEILNSAELVCLMRYISLPSASVSECMVATNQSCKKMGLWLGSGNLEGAELSFIDLNTDGYTCQDIADTRILCLALVTVATEKENWVVAGTQSGSLWAFNTQDEKHRHQLQKMSDSVTCLYCNSFAKQNKQKNFFLAGTADGQLAVFEDRAVKYKAAAPLKILRVGNISTPFMCLTESNYSSEKNIIWGGCGTKILSLSSDLSVQKLIETKTSQLLCHKAYSDANIISIAVDKSIYLAKKNSYFVEIWDKKTEKLCELVDCVHFLKEEVPKLNKESKQKLAYSGRVKSICLQKNTALWIGTGGGHVLLLDLSTRHPIRIISGFCDSVRFMMIAQLGSLKSVVLVLGYCHKGDSEDNKHAKGIRSCVSVWDINLPHEVQNLRKHIEIRRELAEKMKTFSLD